MRTAAAVVLAALWLTGCAADPDPAPEVVVLTTTPTHTAHPQSFIAQFEEWLREGTSGQPNNPSGSLEVILRGGIQ